MIHLKTSEEIELIRMNCQIVSSTLSLVAEILRPGITGKQLDKVAETFIRDQGAYPGFLNYGGFPGSLCISKNDCVVHGIPDDIEFVDGDIVSVDCGSRKNGYYGDAAYTFVVGETTEDIMHLLCATKQSLMLGIAKARTGNRMGDISYAIQHYTEKECGYAVVRELVGHGIGKNLHEKPNVPNYGRRSSGIRLKEGMTIAIEPMINMGGRNVYQASDGWGILTKDQSISAHYEHTVAIREDGPDILSSHDKIEFNIKNNPNLSEIKIKN